MNLIKFIAGILGLFIALSCSGQAAIPSGNSGTGSQGAQMRFQQMERSKTKFHLPVAQKKVPTRNEWVMEYAPLAVILDSLDIGIDSFPTDLTFAEKQNDSIRLNNSSGSDVWFLEGEGIELERVDSTRMRIHDKRGHYAGLTTVGWYNESTFFGDRYSYYFQTYDDFTNYWLNFPDAEINQGSYITADHSADNIVLNYDGLYDVSFFTTIQPNYSTHSQCRVAIIRNPDTDNQVLAETYQDWESATVTPIVVALRTFVDLEAADIIKILISWRRIDSVDTVPKDFQFQAPNFMIQRLR